MLLTAVYRGRHQGNCLPKANPTQQKMPKTAKIVFLTTFFSEIFSGFDLWPWVTMAFVGFHTFFFYVTIYFPWIFVVWVVALGHDGVRWFSCTTVPGNMYNFEEAANMFSKPIEPNRMIDTRYSVGPKVRSPSVTDETVYLFDARRDFLGKTQNISADG